MKPLNNILELGNCQYCLMTVDIPKRQKGPNLCATWSNGSPKIPISIILMFDLTEYEMQVKVDLILLQSFSANQNQLTENVILYKY